MRVPLQHGPEASAVVLDEAYTCRRAMGFRAWRAVPHDIVLGITGLARRPRSSLFENSKPGIRRVSLGGATDNQGNEQILYKLMSTKYPLNCWLAGLAAEMEH